MYSVVQFIEKSKFQVLSVPSSWIKDGIMLWPKASNKTIEEARSSGDRIDGPHRKIPVIVTSTATDFKTAEKSAEELARRDVSDIEIKKKKLKRPRNTKSIQAKNYNSVVKALQETTDLSASPKPGSSKTIGFIGTDVTTESPKIPATPVISHTGNIVFINDENNDKTNYADGLQVLNVTESFTQPEYTPSPAIPHLGNIIYDVSCPVTDVEGPGIRPFNVEEFKSDMKLFMQTTIQKMFDDSFAKLAAQLELNKKAADRDEQSLYDPVASHRKIETEMHLHEWNEQLDSDHLILKYVQYFMKIIPPNSYAGKGGNALYTIVDCLFTRQFWDNFTWTGVSRGQKSSRGFREFGNVIALLLKLVCIGDPEYTAQKLEAFCRNKLFRYSKDRCRSKQLRKSAIRPKRKSPTEINDPTKKTIMVTNDSNDEKQTISIAPSTQVTVVPSNVEPNIIAEEVTVKEAGSESERENDSEGREESEYEDFSSE